MSTYEIRHGGATDVGHVRPTNQDQLLVEGRLAAVADGMGGPGIGEIASELAVRALQEGFQTDPTPAGLFEATRAANQVVWEKASEPELRGMGTTIAAVAVVNDGVDDHLAVVNVGDSRVYRFQGGQLSRLSDDHSLVADLVRAGELTAEEARSHPERHVLTQVLGVAPDVRPHAASAAAASGDRLLLCSDGLFNELHEDEIATVLGGVSDPSEAAAVLVHLANAHGGNDNVTAVVLDLT